MAMHESAGRPNTKHGWEGLPPVVKRNRWLFLLGLLCCWSLWTQARSPWFSEPSWLLAQWISMMLGLATIGFADYLPSLTGLGWIPRLGLSTALMAGLIWILPGRDYTEENLIWATLGWMAFLFFQLAILRICVIKSRSFKIIVSVAIWLTIWAVIFKVVRGHIHVWSLMLLIGSFLLLWKQQWKLGTGLSFLSAGGFGLLILSHGYIRHRLQALGIHLYDTMFIGFQGAQTRKLLWKTSWIGITHPIPYIPNANRHVAIGLLCYSWGWFGLALWYIVLSWILVVAFRIAWHHRGEEDADLLAVLAATLATVVLLGSALSVGLFPGFGGAMPLLGLDPGLAFMMLLMVALLRKIESTDLIGAQSKGDASP